MNSIARMLLAMADHAAYQRAAESELVAASVERRLWSILESAARVHYRDERAHAEFIDVGGEG